ncbi:MAG: immunity protein Imm33 domain-containing protein [Polymorphobacter sp.]
MNVLESDFCLVDQCVLVDGVKVGFLYRDPPEPPPAGEAHGDSGWSLRGEAGDATEAEIDARAIAYVPLSAVLAVDDSWRHLIDSPPGSAFARNPRTWKFEAVDPDED